MSIGEELAKVEAQIINRTEKRKSVKAKNLIINEKHRRRWLVTQGKSGFIDFDDDQISRLKECYNALDDDGSGCVGADEIKVPLIGLGLVDTVEEVDRMLSLVDEDGSGMIEFDEFLDIIKNKSGDVKTRAITEFFKNLTGGKYNTGGLPFPNWVLKE